MSRQYLTTHTIDDAHIADIFSLAATPTQLLSASGSSSIKINSTSSSDFPLVQTLEQAHPLGCHHIVCSTNGKKAASIGFGGEVKIWANSSEDGNGSWIEEGQVTEGNAPGELWALALSAPDGQYLGSTTFDGRLHIWDLSARGIYPQIRTFETKRAFGLAIALSPDGIHTVSGHSNGALYMFNNTTGRLAHALAGLVKPVRCVAFSPASTMLAAGGDAGVISLYEVSSGDQVAVLQGQASWVMSLDWSWTGEWLLSGGWDGKVKVWSIERRICVATHADGTGKALWAVKWLPKGAKRTEEFVCAGANRSISFYREAAGS